MYLDKINQSRQQNLKEVKNDIVNLMYDEARDFKSKKIAEEFKKTYLNKEYDGKFKSDFFEAETSDWITLDNRLGKNIPFKIKKSIFLNKLNSISEIIFLDKAKYVIVIPVEQSREILNEEQKTKENDLILELNNSIEADLSNAIISDLSKYYKSNINQKFLDSF